MAKKLKNLMALVLALSMVLSLVTVPAAALSNEDQIESSGGSKYYNLSGDTTKDGADDHFVTVGKTVAATGTENVFDITLKVNTKSKTDYYELVKDSAVVLTIDFSNTMTQNNIGSKTRLAVALEKAQEFVTSYGEAGQTAGAKRYLAVVAFSTPGQTYIDWIDVSNSSNRSDVLSKIESMANNSFWKKYGSGGTAYRGGATNMEAGLQLTYDLLTASDKPSTDRDYAILLSDGSPTMHIKAKGDTKNVVGDYYYYCACKGSSNSCTGNSDSTGSDVNGVDHTRAKAVADKIKALANTELYAIAVAASAWLDSEKVGSDTAATWLANSIASSSSKMIRADDASGVTSAFKSINTAIKTETIPEKTSIKAGTVTDVLPSNIELVSLPSDASVSGQTITWKINSTSKSHSLTYRVRLKNELSGFSANTDYPTNDSAKLTYKVMLDGEAEGGNKTATFKVPKVEGYTGTLTFNKTSTHNNKALEGCTFTLTHKSDCACGHGSTAITKTGLSNSSGAVTISGIPSGHTYTLKETGVPSGYTCRSESSTVTVSYGSVSVSGSLLSKAGGTVTNTPDSKPMNFTIEKQWVNGKVPSGVSSVTVDICIGNTVKKTVTVTEANGWKTTVELDSVDPSTKQNITYTVKEKVGSNYKAVVGTDTMSASDKTAVLKNVITGTQDITIKKAWSAPSNLQPSVKVRLLQNGNKYADYTLSSSNNWTASVKGLPTYDDNASEYSYSIVELDASGKPLTTNTVALNGHNYTVSYNGFTVTNKLQQEYTSVSGTKTWNVAGLSDAEKNDLSATITLYRNNSAYKTATVTYKNTSYKFENLEVYDLTNNSKYTYSVKETAVSDLASGTWNKSQSGNNFTNTITDNVTISGTKTWVDPNEAERPESITIRLKNKSTGAVVESKTITATPVMDGETKIGYTWDGVSLSYSFTVPKYDAKGAVIPYEIVEDAVALYQPTYNGYNVTNTLNGGEKTVSATKIWVDAESSHDEISVGVFRTDSNAKVATLALNDANGWTASTNLAKYENGKELSYYVCELDASGNAIADGGRYGEFYTVSYDNSGDSWTVKNTIDQASVSVSLQKTWRGDGDKPDVTFTLYKNGSVFKTCTLADLDADGKYTFENLDKYTFSGNTCILNVYTVKETMSGTAELLARYYYTAAVEGIKDDHGVYQFVNEFHNEPTTVEGSKIWHGMGYEEEVWVGVFEGETMLAKTQTEELRFVFNGLTKFNTDGTLKTYYVRELEVEENAEEPGTVNVVSVKEEGTYYTAEGKEYEVTYVGADIHNTLKQENTELTVTKVWRGPAADSVTFELYRTDDASADPVTTGKTLTLTSADADSNGDWTGKFENLEVYNPARTARYVYSVKETEVTSAAGRTYTSEEVEANVFRNTVNDPNNGTFTVNKLWAGDGYTAENGEAVKVQLYIDGVAYGAAVELNSTNFWTHTFTDLPLYDDVTYAPVTYSVKELDASGEPVADGEKVPMNNGSERYEVTYVGGTITNTFQDRDSFKYRVLRNYTYSVNGNAETYTDDDTVWTTVSKGETVSIDASQWLDCATDDMDVTYDFVPENTAVYQGTDGTYAFDLADGVVAFVTEKYVDGESWYEVNLYYTKSVWYTPTENISVEKVWNDNGNEAGIRPASIQVELLKDGASTGSVAALSDANGWAHVWNNLPMGNYSVAEVNVPEGYTSSVTNAGNYFTITNTLTEEIIEEPEPPMADLPEEIPEEEIFEEDVPLADVPPTGDMTALWAAASVVSVAGLVFLGKKRKDEE